MKKIKGIDEAVKPFHEIISQEQVAQLPSYGRLYNVVLGNSMSKNASDAIELMKIGLKIDGAKDIELEDAEYNRLKEALEANPLKWPAGIIAPLTNKLLQAEIEKRVI